VPGEKDYFSLGTPGFGRFDAAFVAPTGRRAQTPRRSAAGPVAGPQWSEEERQWLRALGYTGEQSRFAHPSKHRPRSRQSAVEGSGVSGPVLGVGLFWRDHVAPSNSTL
jgi:hypothetical protein